MKTRVMGGAIDQFVLHAKSDTTGLRTSYLRPVNKKQ